MAITSFAGEKLLDKPVIEQIKKESDLLLAKKDVAAAYLAAGHLKKELAKLPADKAKAVVNDYRPITTNLKVLALPLLSAAELKNLLLNNLLFLDKKHENYLILGIPAWLASQADALSAQEEVWQWLAGSPFLEKVRAQLGRESTPPPSSQPPVLVLPKSDVMFDDDENQEISKQAEKLSGLGAKSLAVAEDNVANLASEIYKLSGRKESEELFIRRGSALIKSRLRDVRAPAQLREYLTRPFPGGGLALNGQALEQALRLVENEYNALHNLPTLPEVKINPAPASADAGFVSALASLEPLTKSEGAEASSSEDRPIPAVATAEHTLRRMPDETAGQLPTETPILANGGEAVDMFAGTDSLPAISSPSRMPRAFSPELSSLKPKIQDVKPAMAVLRKLGRTVSPADELKLLTLPDFRSFGPAQKAAERILEKISLLSSESLGARREGVQSFRESDLYKLYLAIGHASLTQNRKLTDALADKSVNEEAMSEDEFFAIATLNSKLK